MSMATLETAILAELRQVSGVSKLRKKDILEWSTGEVKVEEGETLFFLPSLKIHCSVRTEALGKTKKAK